MSHSHVAPPGFRTPNPLPGRSKRRPARAIDAARRRREAAADRDVAYGTAQFAGATLGSDAAERAMAIGKVEIPPKRMTDYRYGSWLMTKVPRGSDPNVFYSAYRGAYLMTAETDATYGNEVDRARRENPVKRSRNKMSRPMRKRAGHGRKANPVAAEDKFYANPYGGAPGFYFSSQEEYDHKSKELYKKTGAEEWSIEFIDGPTIDAKLFGAIDDLIGQDMTVWFDEIQDKDDQFKVALYWLLTSYGERDIEKAISDAENEVIIREGDVEDWARDLVDDMGGPAELDEQTLQSHFDFESYGFALRANGELPDEYEDLDDAEAAEAYVRDYYGDNLKKLPKDVLTDHFDFRDFGEDAELGGEIHELRVGGQDYVIEYTG